MRDVQLQATQDNTYIRLETDGGFTLAQGVASVSLGGGGTSRPSPDSTVENGLKHLYHLEQLSSAAVEFYQTLENRRSEEVYLDSIITLDAQLDLAGKGWRVVHSDLFKKEAYFDGKTKYTDGLFADIPGAEGEFGLSEDFSFPGIAFTHPERGTVLMGVLSQERCKPVWRIQEKRGTLQLTAREHFSGIPAIPVKPGAEFASERWVLLTVPGNLEDAVESYYSLLRQRLTFMGTDSILRQAIVWGSWNYNRRSRGHMDITHDMIVNNAQALPKLVSDKPRFVMIDDGYQRGKSQQRTGAWFGSCLEIFHPEGEPPHDPDLFPHGMKATATAIRNAGCEPAIWTTPRIHRRSSLAEERPDLLLQLQGRDSFGDRSAYLDYSIPEVRDYTRNAWNIICNEWGYKGIKLDFWSLQFEIPDVRFRNQDRTAIELRNRFLQDLRDCIPTDGYIVTGVVTNSGNPFVGRYIDAARAGTDIGDGTARTIQSAASVLAAASPFYRHDCLLADADSIGWNADISPGHNRLWATTAFLSGVVFEIGGDLTNLSADARELLTKVVEHAGPAQRTLNGISGPAVNNVPADHIKLEREDAVLEAYLNWTGYPREITIEKPHKDIWTGKMVSGVHKIPPQDAVMFMT